jgi:MFS family permease
LGEPPEPERHRLGTTGAGTIAGWAIAGLVLGRLLKPALSELDGTAPQIGWVQVAALYLVAVILGAVARATHKALQVRRERLQPHQAVNRLVLAKACALAGALVTGGYLGYALSWVGDEAELSGERIAMSLAAALGAALTVAGSLFLERACRVSGAGEES